MIQGPVSSPIVINTRLGILSTLFYSQYNRVIPGWRTLATLLICLTPWPPSPFVTSSMNTFILFFDKDGLFTDRSTAVSSPLSLPNTTHDPLSLVHDKYEFVCLV